VIALVTSPLFHDLSVIELLIQTFRDGLAEVKESLCRGGSTSDMFLEENYLKGLTDRVAKKCSVNNTFLNFLRFKNVSYVVSVGKLMRRMHIHICYVVEL
jgi:hypothetical protein